MKPRRPLVTLAAAALLVGSSAAAASAQSLGQAIGSVAGIVSSSETVPGDETTGSLNTTGSLGIGEPTLGSAPASVQDAADLTYLAFELADEYRMPVMILGDGIIGQMMEPVVMPKAIEGALPEKSWATRGREKGKRHIINSLYIQPEELEGVINRIHKRYEIVAQKETCFESTFTEDAEILIAAYGTAARIAKKAVVELRKQGIAAGLFRPITLWPFPSAQLASCAPQAKLVLTVEMSCGQMVEDVRLAMNGKIPVEFYGRTGGVVPSWREIVDKALALQKEIKIEKTLSCLVDITRTPVVKGKNAL